MSKKKSKPKIESDLQAKNKIPPTIGEIKTQLDDLIGDLQEEINAIDARAQCCESKRSTQTFALIQS